MIVYFGATQAGEYVNCSDHIIGRQENVEFFCGAEVISILDIEYKDFESHNIHADLLACLRQIGVNNKPVLLVTDSDKIDFSFNQGVYHIVNLFPLQKTFISGDERGAVFNTLQCVKKKSEKEQYPRTLRLEKN